jgi:hypothetical protein
MNNDIASIQFQLHSSDTEVALAGLLRAEEYMGMHLDSGKDKNLLTTAIGLFLDRCSEPLGATAIWVLGKCNDPVALDAMRRYASRSGFMSHSDSVWQFLVSYENLTGGTICEEDVDLISRIRDFSKENKRVASLIERLTLSANGLH